MLATPAVVFSGRRKELRIALWDESHKSYSQEEFLDYYGQVRGCILWEDAVIYKDADGAIRHVLVIIGQLKRWGLAERISQESVFLAGMIACDDDSPVLDLRQVLGYDISTNVCVRLLDYLCGCDSDWWEKDVPCMGALDAADKLGLQRLLSCCVDSRLKDRWERFRSGSDTDHVAISVSSDTERRHRIHVRTRERPKATQRACKNTKRMTCGCCRDKKPGFLRACMDCNKRIGPCCEVRRYSDVLVLCSSCAPRWHRPL